MSVPSGSTVTFAGLHFERLSDNYSAPAYPAANSYVNMFDLVNGGNTSGSLLRTRDGVGGTQDSYGSPNLSLDTNTPYGVNEFWDYDNDAAGVPNTPGLSGVGTGTGAITWTITEPAGATGVSLALASGTYNGAQYYINGSQVISVDGTGTTDVILGDGNDQDMFGNTVSLSPGVAFTFKAIAFNSAGSSSFSSGVTAYTLNSAPSAPTVTGGIASVTASWTAPTPFAMLRSAATTVCGTRLRLLWCPRAGAASRLPLTAREASSGRRALSARMPRPSRSVSEVRSTPNRASCRPASRSSNCFGRARSHACRLLPFPPSFPLPPSLPFPPSL